MTTDPVPAAAAAPGADRLLAALDEVAADHDCGYIDKAEAEQRLIDRGFTPPAAQAHVDGWRDGHA